MRFTVALREALKYHAVAFVPNLIGGSIVVVSLWIGVIDPAIGALPGAAGGPEGMLEALLAAPYNLPVVLVGVIGGVAIRRLGKTALLFKIHGTAVVDVVDDELIEESSVSARSVDGSDRRSSSENGDVGEDGTEEADSEDGTEEADSENANDDVDTETATEDIDTETATEDTAEESDPGDDKTAGQTGADSADAGDNGPEEHSG